MKSLHNSILLQLLLLSFGVVSCNKEWEGELYDHSVSFVKNGITDIRVKYNEDGKVSYRLPIIVSGSTHNASNMLVNIALDSDSLADANHKRFNTREDLYFLELEKKHYDIPKTVEIKAGEDLGYMDIHFDLIGINMVRNHVLPLTIIEGEGYVPNYRKHFRKALLNVIPYNDYSGTYAATNANVSDGSGSILTTENRNARVVDANTVFFYAGITQEDLPNREDYKIHMEFIPADETNKDIGTIKLTAPNPSIDFKDGGNGTYLVTRMKDEILPYMEHIYVTVNLQYSYKEKISDDYSITYTVDGSMSMKRSRNTTIPDEDQAWQW